MSDKDAVILGLMKMGTDLATKNDRLTAALRLALPIVENAYHTNPDPDGSTWRTVKAMRAAF